MHPSGDIMYVIPYSISYHPSINPLNINNSQCVTHSCTALSVSVVHLIPIPNYCLVILRLHPRTVSAPEWNIITTMLMLMMIN